MKTLITLLLVATLALTDFGMSLLVALTDMQMDKILDMVAAGMRAVGEAVKAVWITLAPALVAYLAWRQHTNNKARKEGQDAIAAKVETVSQKVVAEAVNPVHVELHEGPPLP